MAKFSERNHLLRAALAVLPLLTTWNLEAHAARGGIPEYFFMPGPRAASIDAGYHKASGTTEVENLSGSKLSDVKSDTSGFAGRLQIGLFSDWALFGSSTWYNEEIDTTDVGSTVATPTKDVGMGDIKLGIKTLNAMGGMALPLSLGTYLSKGERKNANGTLNGNNVSGGNDFFVSLGLFTALGGNIIGVNAEDRMRGKRTSTDQAVPENKTREESGNELALSGFLELNLGGANLDVHGSHVSVDSIKNTDLNTGSVSTDKAYAYNVLGAGLQTQLTSSINLRFNYDQYLYPKIEYASYQTKAYSYTDLSVRLRLEF